MSDAGDDAQRNDPGTGEGGQSSFEARARKASESVRSQLAATTPGDELGLRRARRPMHRTALPRVAAVAALVAGTAVIGPSLLGGGGSGSTGLGGAGVAYAAGPLKAFADCDAALGYYKEYAPDYLIDQAGSGSGGASADGRAERMPMAGAEEAGADSATAASGSAYSTTNVAEAGVDEPDLVKTDGKVIVAVARGRAHLISARDGRLTKRATLPATDVRNVFLSGTRVLVFSGQRPEEVERGPQSAQRQLLTTYDISTLRTPKRVATLAVDGEVLDARLVGTQVRVATAFSPDLDIQSPSYGRTGGLTAGSRKRLRDAVARSTVDDWLPTYTLTDGSGAQVSSGRLVECPDLARPDEFSGIDTVAVSSFDITSALQDRRTVGVVAGGQQLYATDTATYVTTTEWVRENSSTPTTSLHKFSTASSGATAYRGSGQVPGTLLNQYSMSEAEGVLRVATTLSERRGWVNAQLVNEGVVTMLREEGGALTQIGQIGGLGRKDNESIRAVRFIGDQGYVVTFRQTDPLYVLDLRDPAAPRITGELKIPGYSGYLHPVGSDLLLGVGQSGTGKIQFSLFDISDPAAPRRTDTQGYGWGNAAAEFDQLAFLSWEPRDLVIAPITSYGREKRAFTGLVLLRADERGLREVARIAPPRSAGPAVRSLVIGDDLYVLSEGALQSHRLDGYGLIERLKL